MKCNQKAASINQTQWERELDTLGTNSDLREYIRMLEKAPAKSRSLQALTNFIQGKLS